MAKGNKVKNFNRTASHRKSMIRNMALSLIHYEVITTTDAKAKALKDYVEKLMIRVKKNDAIARRYVSSLTNDKLAVKKIFEVLVPRYADRVSGFVSIRKVGVRSSDSSEMSEVSLIGGKKVLHIMKPKKVKIPRRAQAAKPQAKQTAKTKTEIKKEEPKKAEKAVEKKPAEVVAKPEKEAEKPEQAKEESKKEEPKENLAQRLGRFLGFRNRSSVKPEDEK